MSRSHWLCSKSSQRALLSNLPVLLLQARGPPLVGKARRLGMPGQQQATLQACHHGPMLQSKALRRAPPQALVCKWETDKVV